MVNIWDEINRLQNEDRAGILITVIDKKGMGPSVVGRKMLVDDTGRIAGSVGGGELEFVAIKKAQELLITREYDIEKYILSGKKTTDTDTDLAMICGGTLTLLFEYLPVPPTLYIMGTGHIGRALFTIMSNLDWRIFPVKYTSHGVQDEFSYPVQAFADIIAKGESPQGVFVVIAGFSNEEEYQMLKGIYQAKWQLHYVGLVASSHKSRLMVNRLTEELGDSIDLGGFHSPAGLDIGGNTPEEIALSIAAQIQSIRYGKR